MFKSSDRYGTLNSFDVVKLVALFAMILDHIGYYLLPHSEWLRVAGRMAFPLFLFLVGYSGSWKVREDLVVWAALVVACAAFTHHHIFPLNILVTILVVRGVLCLLLKYSTLTPMQLARIYLLCILAYPLFYWCEYSTPALLFAICGYLRRTRPQARETQIFLYATMALHTLFESATFGFHWPAQLGMLAVLGITALLMLRFTLTPVSADLPSAPLKWAARNTLPLYGLHIMLLMIAERIYFPARLLHFHWF